jgi:hypothetical protein
MCSETGITKLIIIIMTSILETRGNPSSILRLRR